MKHLSILDALNPILSQEELQDNVVATETIYSDMLYLGNESDKGLDIVSALESLSEVVSQINTLKPSHRALIQVAADLAVCGSDIHPESLIPALEDEDKDGGKQEMISKIKEKIKAILQAIGNFIVKIWNNFKEFLAKVSNYFNTFDDQIKILKKRLVAAPSKSNTTHLKVKLPASGIDGGIKFIEPNRFAAEVAKYLATTEKTILWLHDLNTSAKNDSNTIEVILKSGQVSKMKELFANLKELSRDNQEENLLGGLALVFTSEEDSNSSDTDSGKLKNMYRSSRVRASSNFRIDTDVQEIPVMSLPEISNLIGLIGKLNRLLDDNSNLSLTQTSKFLTNTIKSTVEHVNKSLKDFTAFNASNLDDVLTLAHFAQAVPLEFLSWVSNYGTVVPSAYIQNTFHLLNTLIHVADKQLKAYEEDLFKGDDNSGQKIRG